MNFESLKEKLRDQFTELWGRIQETSLFQNAREKFEALNTRMQKIIIASIAMLGVLFLFSFPYSNITSSQGNLEVFEENRSLIRRLLKAAKTLKEPSPLPPEMPGEVLTSEVNRALDEFHLVGEQMGGVQPLNEKATTLVPDGVKQVAVMLQLKKLNLKQIVEISHRLQSLSIGVRLMGLDIRENAASSHYFDVNYKLVNFSVPRVAMPIDTGKDKGRGAPKPKPKEPDADKGDE